MNQFWIVGANRIGPLISVESVLLECAAEFELDRKQILITVIRLDGTSSQFTFPPTYSLPELRKVLAQA